MKKGFSLVGRNRDVFGLSDPFFDDFFNFPLGGRLSNNRETMRVDIKDEGSHYLLLVDLPSIDRNNIQMDLEDGYLTIRAAHEETNDEKDRRGNYIRRERFSGTYQRSFYVGDSITEQDIDASYDNGTLSVKLLKKDDTTHPARKSITIK